MRGSIECDGRVGGEVCSFIRDVGLQIFANVRRSDPIQNSVVFGGQNRRFFLRRLFNAGAGSVAHTGLTGSRKRISVGENSPMR